VGERAARMPPAGITYINQSFYLIGVRRVRTTALNIREEHNELA
jgi:hypothetical protein